MSKVNIDRPAAVAAILDALEEALAEDNVPRAQIQLRHLRNELQDVLSSALYSRNG